MSKKKQLKKLPSRLKYDQANPTFSFRLPLETHTRLLDDVRTLGQSFAEWVKDHLDQDDKRALCHLIGECDGVVVAAAFQQHLA